MSDEDRLEKLLRDAGPRSPLPEDDLASIREAARAEWRQHYGVRAARPARVRWWIGLAAAAVVAAGFGIVWWTRSSERTPHASPSTAETVATVERASEGSPWKVGAPLTAGTVIETGGAGTPGRLALRMAGGTSARFDAGTRALLVSEGLIELTEGAVYVDTLGGREVAVRAAAGLFHPVGTQFEVRVADGATLLKVREGTVEVSRGLESVRAVAGEALIVDDDGRLARRAIGPFGPEWEWVLATAPMPDIEGVKVRAFLDWIAREAGWRVEFADREAAALADSVDLHGSISHLTPLEATGVVLSSAGLGHRVSDGKLVVWVARKADR